VAAGGFCRTFIGDCFVRQSEYERFMVAIFRILPVLNADGPLQMALDEVLLQQAERGIPSFRIYLWNEPTLSLGYFQSAGDRLRDPALAGLPFVRRMTGGGAIVHGRAVALAEGVTLTDWTYAVTLPSVLVAGKAACHWHLAIHRALCRVLQQLGVAAEVVEPVPGEISCGEAHVSSVQAADSAQKQPASLSGRDFLCFARPAAGDIVWQGHKIVGSAQRLRKGALLQHGSMFLPHWPCEWKTLAELWLAELGWSSQITPWQEQEFELAQRLAESKYRQPAWNLRR
jgi:lipoate-protein ligase A